MRNYRIAQGTQLHPLWRPKQERSPKRRDTCIRMADSFSGTSETNAF